MKKTVLYTLIFTLISMHGKMVLASDVNQPSPPAKISVSAEKQIVQLTAGHWDSFNREKLNQLLLDAQNATPHTTYAVFDFDNTTAFLDIEEATLIYQLENLKFSMTPEILQEVIYKDIPQTNFKAEYNNRENQPVNITAVGTDIIDSYRWLYDNYAGLKGDQPLSKIKNTAHYQNFIVKMRYLYDAIGGSFDHKVSYPWVTYLFSGMSKKEVAKLANETIQWQKKQSIEKVTWESPVSLPGQAGVVKTVWRNGFRLLPEMQDLYKKLQQSGVDVYVVSASALDIVKEIMTQKKYGFSLPENHIYAMHPQYDKEGKLTHSLDPLYPQTQGKGKTETINKFISQNYANSGPVLVAGDSEGDQNMMSDFNDTRLVLIINRLRSADTIIGKLSAQAAQEYKKDNNRILLQGRDENAGEFLPSQSSLLIGASKPALLP